jgi:hypothetical protein
MAKVTVMNELEYCAVPFRDFPIDRHHALLTSPAVDGARPVARMVPFILAACAVPRTLTEHARAFLTKSPESQPLAIRQTLEALVKAGLLQSVGAHTATSQLLSGQGRITTVAIITAERPQRLERCLKSLLAHLDSRGSGVSVLVVDDSVAEEAVRRNQAAAFELGRCYGRRVDYVGRMQREQLCHLLVKAGADRPSVLCALGLNAIGRSTGGARNAMALATAGERVLVLDDDVVCTLWSPPVRTQHRLTLCGHIDPRSYAFFDSRSHAIPVESMMEADLLEGHGLVVGRSLKDLVRAASGSCDTTSACRHLLATCAEGGSRARVRVSMSGIAGDVLEPPSRMLLASGGWRTELESSRDAFESAMTGRETRRIATTFSITHDPVCELVASAVDNSELIPPCLPVGCDRGRLFGVLMEMCDSQALFAHVPLGIVLDSGLGDDYRPDVMEPTPTMLVADVILESLTKGGVPSWRSDVSDRMRWIGTHVSALGSLPSEEFGEAVKALVLERRSRELLKVESILDAGSAYPSYWATALVRYRVAVLEMLCEPAFHRPADAESAQDASARQDWQTIVAGFGDLLRAWPEIWHTAAELKVRDSIELSSAHA